METIDITNGPSTEELFFALRLIAEERITLFEVERFGVKKHIPVIVNSIGDGNGSGNVWNLTLTTDEKFLSPEFFIAMFEIKRPGTYASKKLDFSEIKKMIENERLMGGGPTLSAYKIGKPVTIQAPLYSTQTREGLGYF